MITKPHMEKGFSLIEMLITISIAMVLAALIAAGTKNSLAAARKAEALAHLRQIVSAMHQYASDNNEYFPLGYYYKQGSGEKTFASELAPYLGGSINMLNPSANPFVSPTSVLRVKPNTEIVPSTYSVHGLLCGDTSLEDRRIKRNRVSRPTKVILIGEGGQRPSSTYAGATLRFPTEFQTANSTQSLDAKIPVGPDSDTVDGMGWLRYRTQGGAVVGMVDGHCELMPKGSVTYANVIADR